MANNNYQKNKTNPHANTVHVNAIMPSSSSIKNEKVIVSKTLKLFIIKYSTQQP